MPHILIASTDLPALYASMGQDVVTSDADDEVVAEALRRQGAAVDIVCWDDPDADWAAVDAVLIRSTWDYRDRRDEFVAWAARVGAVTTLLPDADVVRWNTHKSYLLELEDRGAPIVPTAWLAAGDDVDLATLAADRGWSEVAAKPAIGAGSVGLVLAPDPAAAQGEFDRLVADHDVLVQPLLRRIADEGELSVICIEGRVSHTVRKRPAAGQLRVQIEFGASYDLVDLDRDRASLAEWVVAATGVEPLFARVDLVPGDDGTWQVGEVELVEPALYLRWAPGADDRFATAVLARLAADGSTA